MNKKTEYISEKELEELDRFLVERIDEDIADADSDEGILGLTELDGFFVAIVSAPQMIPPSVWLSAMWGDFEPVWESQKQAEKTFGLLMSIMNSVNLSLSDPKERFQPMFEHRDSKGSTYVAVDDWCFGYMRGVALWNSLSVDSLEMRVLLTPIKAFGTYEGLDLLREKNDDEVGNIERSILSSVIEIFKMRNKQSAELAAAKTFKRETVKVGRNELCPCGSGKKFKKCCLH